MDRKIKLRKILHSIKIGNKSIDQAIDEILDMNQKTILPISEETKLQLILRKYHGHTKLQWENDLVKKYPYCEIPKLIEMTWEMAQIKIYNKWKKNIKINGIEYIHYNSSDLRFTGWEHECIIINRCNNNYLIPINRYEEISKGKSREKIEQNRECCGYIQHTGYTDHTGQYYLSSKIHRGQL